MTGFKILIVTAWYKSEAAPTAASFVLEQAQMLQRAGHEVVVLHTYLSGTFLETLRGRYGHYSERDEEGIWTVRIGHPVWLPGVRQWHYRWLCKKALRWAKQYQRQHPAFDLIHAHSMFMGGVVGGYLAKYFNIPFYHTEHTSGLIFAPRQYTHADIEWLQNTYRLARQVFFVSQFALEQMCRRYHISNVGMSVLPNMVNQIFFDSIKDAPSSGQGRMFLCIANLVKIKRIDFLLNAWRAVQAVEPNWVLTIAGEGPLKEQLVRQAQELGLGSSVRWLPRLSRQDVKIAIDDHHILVSTSDLETFGLTVAESLARGRPVVVTDSGGVRDIVGEGDGRIVATDSPVEFAQAMLQVGHSITHFEPVVLQQRCREKFAEQVVLKQLEAHYQRE